MINAKLSHCIRAAQEPLAQHLARQTGLPKSMTHLPSMDPHDNLLVNLVLVQVSVLCMCAACVM